MGGDAVNEGDADETTHLRLAKVVDFRGVDQCRDFVGGRGRNHGGGDSKISRATRSGGRDGDGGGGGWDSDQRHLGAALHGGPKTRSEFEGRLSAHGWGC